MIMQKMATPIYSEWPFYIVDEAKRISSQYYSSLTLPLRTAP